MSNQRKTFPSAAEDATHAQRKPGTAQTRSSSYRLAYEDLEFLERDDLRAQRLELELLKAEIAFKEAGIDRTVVVFGSARSPAPESSDADARPDFVHDYEEARRFAGLIAHSSLSAVNPFYVMTGGGPGIMEAANRGAQEAGGKTVGLNIVLPHEQAPNPYITPDLSFQFHYFAIRKMHFLLRAAALVCFPGGFGTMDELFETLTLIQTGKVAPMPVLLFREAWWRRVVDFEAMAEDGVISTSDLNIFKYVETAEDAYAAILSFYTDCGPPFPL